MCINGKYTHTTLMNYRMEFTMNSRESCLKFIGYLIIDISDATCNNPKVLNKLNIGFQTSETGREETGSEAVDH